MQIEIPSDVTRTITFEKLHNVKYHSKEAFAAMYATIVGSLLNLSLSAISILKYCTEQDNANNVIIFTSEVMKIISVQSEITPKLLKQGLSELTKKKVLSNKGKKVYTISKEYCWQAPYFIDNFKYTFEISFKNNLKL
jgi:hypothetical protein